ncbi:hypothetical protein J437_LFUL014838 [Ladona fulva]|uniref:Kazal-like domain-containing protein n=1 Tax=Ladona fulva TaxID=123851 RepID=A0A8K0KLC5_LADFU|nr:hypothetical protein J437_LFUL014838 [Ladona fulva]
MRSIYLIFFAAVVCMTTAQKRDCNFACITLYDPICGVNKAGHQMTFSVGCEMDSHNCRNPGNEYTFLRKGSC